MFGGKVERAKRGPRKQQRNVFLNLKRADEPASKDPDHDVASLSEEQADVEVLEGWNIVKDKSNYRITPGVGKEKMEWDIGLSDGKLQELHAQYDARRAKACV
ncbi:hypothetical protein ACROYT_G015583 [Oculina patagonica]